MTVATPHLNFQPPRRAGFSLMELLIVLGVLVIVAAMATPALISEMRNNRVYESGEAVREVLAESRRLAVDSGIDYQFRYEPGGRYFVVLPNEVEPTVTNSVIGQPDTASYMRLSGELSEDFQIRAMDGTTETQERLSQEWFGDIENGGMLAQKSWSAPLLFRFDGTADDGQFRISDKELRTVELSVRGLTGSVSLSQVYQESL